MKSLQANLRKDQDGECVFKTALCIVCNFCHCYIGCVAAFIVEPVRRS